MPDIFVPFDSARFNDLYSSFIRKGIVNRFVNECLDENRKSLLNEYIDFKSFNAKFAITEKDFEKFLSMAEEEEIEVKSEDLDHNVDFVKLQLKALIARNIFENGDYFEVISGMDHEIEKAMEVMNDEKAFGRLMIGE